MECEGLKNIQLSEYIREIEGYAFYGCESLENINIPERVKVIEDGTFLNAVI